MTLLKTPATGCSQFIKYIEQSRLKCKAFCKSNPELFSVLKTFMVWSPERARSGMKSFIRKILLFSLSFESQRSKLCSLFFTKTSSARRLVTHIAFLFVVAEFIYCTFFKYKTQLSLLQTVHFLFYFVKIACSIYCETAYLPLQLNYLAAFLHNMEFVFAWSVQTQCFLVFQNNYKINEKLE